MKVSASCRLNTFHIGNVRPIQIAMLIAFAVALWCSTAFAQSGAGSVQGTVTDASGAIIPGAIVNVVNTATNIASSTKASSDGFYQAPGLFSGTYVVTVTAPGMESYKRTIELRVGQNFVANVALTPGSISQQVTVSSNSVQLVTTDNGAITSTLENARINELPMNGRSLVTLVNQTTPGIESGPESVSSANGQEGAATEYVVDGASLANLEFGGVYTASTAQAHGVDPDSVQEVKVESIASPAQYASPMTVVMTTKSGTNQLHGTIFETARNNAFGIARSRSNPSYYAAPQYVRNEFGFSVGGPIIIPHLYNGKNKSFFFFAYERFSLAQHASDNMTVPTVAMRNGDFSGLVNSSNVTQQLYNPYTTNLSGSTACLEPPSLGTASPSQQWCRAPFVNNQIPMSLESPTAVILNAITPLPTNANNPLVTSNLVYNFPELAVTPQYTFRLDHQFNEKNRVYLRYTQNSSPSTGPHSSTAAYTLTDSAAGIPASVSGLSSTYNGTFAAALGFTHVFSPTFYSETVVGDSWLSERDLAGGQPNTNWESKLGVPNNFGEAGFPQFASILQPINGTMYAFQMVWSIPDVDENLTKTIGKHQLQFGGRYRLERIGEVPDQTADAIGFSGEDTGLENPATGSKPAAYANTGYADADEFLGGASSYSVNLEPPYQNIHQLEIDGYFQDDYRVSKSLTLNLGLRWEAHPAPFMAKGIMMGFDMKNDAVVTTAPTSQLIAEGFTTQAIITNDQLIGMKFETPSTAGLPPMLVDNYNANFSPRVGVAWQPFSSKWGTVLRGGLGRYIYPLPIRENYRRVNRNNPFSVAYSNSYTSSGYAPDNLQDYMLRSQPTTSSSYNYASTAPGGAGGTPVLGINSTGVVNTASTSAITPGQNIISLDPRSPPTFVTEANFTIEQPMKWNSVLRVSYVYTHGTNLANAFYYNGHPSAYSWEVQTGTPTPTGTASVVSPTNTNTGEGPYDNLTYGSGNAVIQKSGWSNYNALQANYQRLYHAGSAWQISAVWAKSMRSGGDYGGSSGDEVDPYANYINTGPTSVTATPVGGTLTAPNLPPPPPPGTPVWGYYKALNRWENYMQDASNPWLHVQFNGLLALPFGRGQHFLTNAGKALNEVIGGWQVAGSGRVIGQEFSVNTTNWGPTSPLHLYKHHSITDCRSGTCLKSMEWFNGYIPPTAIAGNLCAAGLATVVSGLPAGEVPYQTPIDTMCSTPSGGKAVVDKYYGLNDVTMNGVTGQAANTVIAYGIVPSNNDNGASGGAIDVTNPFGHTVLVGPTNYSADLSLFKVFTVTERVNLRMNVDAFNAFNIQGFNNPSSSDGTSCYSPGGVGCSSYNTPRQLQFSARLTF